MRPYRNDEADYQLYVLAELRYGGECDRAGIPEDERFPSGWYGSRDYRFKTEVIAQALRRGVRIGDLNELALREDADPALREMCAGMARRFGI